MPSGLLNGRGCYDSLRKCENDSSVFLTIRNHGTPFIVEQRQAMERANVANSLDKNSIEAKVKEQFVTGNFPFLLKFIKLIFMVLFFPFHFCLAVLPSLIARKILVPVYMFIKKILQRIVPPCVKGFLLFYRPIAAICKKIAFFGLKCLEALKTPLYVVYGFLQKKNILFKSSRRPFQSKVAFGNKCLQRCVYNAKVACVWIKLLMSYGFKQVREKGQTIKSAKSKD